MRLLKTLLALSVPLLVIVVLALLPAPIASHRGAIFFKAILFAFIVTGMLIPRIGIVRSPRLRPALIRLVHVAAVVIPTSALILLFTLKPGTYLVAALLLLGATAIVIGLFRGVERDLKGAGVVSLLLFSGSILTLESGLRGTPTRYLQQEVAVTPPLYVWKDKGEHIYTVNGFRGRRPCIQCDESPIRIFTMGGSSTYGIPMYYTVATYAAVLERMLHKRRPNEKFEVYNGGIPGFGVYQILDSLNRTILKFKPDIVTVNAGFNDGGPPPGWYTGLGSRSDLDGYQRLQLLRWIKEWPPFRVVHDSRLYGWLNFAIGRLKQRFPEKKRESKPGERRTPPAEFKEGLRRIVALGKKRDFLPVFILEPFNQTPAIEDAMRINDYHKAMVEVAREHGVPLIDSLTALNRHSGAWLFYDVIHTNEEAHAIIAQSIYEGLFLGSAQTEWGRRFFAERGISLNAPDVRRNHQIQIERTAASDPICFSARAPFQSRYPLSIEISSEGRAITTVSPLESEFNEFTFRISDHAELDPIIDLSLRARIIEETKFGPVMHIDLLSGTKEHKFKNFMRARGIRIDPTKRGLHAVVFGGRTGIVKALGTFDSSIDSTASERFVRFLEKAPAFSENGAMPMVAIAVQGDGHLSHPQITAALRSLGGTGRTPVNEEAFAFLGRVGLKPGEALEQFGESSARIQFGEPDSSAAELLEIKDFRPCSRS